MLDSLLPCWRVPRKPLRNCAINIVVFCTVVYAVKLFVHSNYDARINPDLVSSIETISEEDGKVHDSWTTAEPTVAPTKAPPAESTAAPVRLACVIPDLTLGAPEQKKSISCTQESDWVYGLNGSIFISQQKPDLKCMVNYYWRKDDFKATYKLENLTSNGTQSQSDFFVSNCSAAGGAKFISAHATVVRSEEAIKRAQTAKKLANSLGLNVYMFGYDTVSRLDFIKRMPRTYKYITEELGAVVLKGYNIVGDGTPQALIPMLTGQTEVELPNTRKRTGNKAQYVNVYPFVWYDYRDHGYVTMWNEDSINVGIFVYRLKGFSTQPTDHYLRTFFIEAEKRYTNGGKCLGDRKVFSLLLRYSEDFFRAYPDVPKFGISFSDLSHDNHGLLSAADDDTFNHLKYFENSGYLNNTMIILMSDHGPRFAHDRFSQQGKFEERLPFYSLIMPPWFERAHPLAMKNLRQNAERLTTPFDIHPTLKDVLDFGGGKRKVDVTEQRGISLFDEIPAERICAHAGVEPHWCTCMQWTNVTDLNDKLIIRLIDDLINKMNNVTESIRDKCAPLRFASIKHARLFEPTKDLMNFKQSKDADGWVPDLTGKTEHTLFYYELMIITEPANHIYEASIQYDKKANTTMIDLGNISLLSSHAKWSSCLERDRLLQKYCVCRSALQ